MFFRVVAKPPSRKNMMDKLRAADHRMYSDETRELARHGLCDQDPVHEAMSVIQQVRDRIIDMTSSCGVEVVVVETVTFAYLNEYRLATA